MVKMSNEDYLLNLYNSYPNAHYFTIKDNKLRLELNDKIWEIPIKNEELTKINPNVFLLHPIESFEIIYMEVLLTKDIIDNNEESFIKKYTLNYLEVNKKVLKLNDSNLQLEHSMLSIPIYTCYDPKYINKPASNCIRGILDNYQELTNEDGGRGNSRARINPNVPSIGIKDGMEAGFITLALIIGAVVVTITYITTYILNK